MGDRHIANQAASQATGQAPRAGGPRLVFTGTDGAGKSTQISRTLTRLGERGLTTRRYDKWDIFDRDRFTEGRFVREPVEDLRLCIAEMEGDSRAMFLFWVIATTLKGLGTCDVDIIDGYWYKHAASELTLGCSRPLIDALGAAMPPPDHVLYLRVDPELALARKPEVTRYECGRDPELSPDSFLRHQHRLRATLDGWAKDYGWTVVDANQGPEQVSAEVDRWVDHHVPTR
jgi:dTMP kinase